jgi:hypothetical protein
MRRRAAVMTLVCLIALPAGARAQDTTKGPPPAPRDSAHADSTVPIPPPPTPAQERYMNGLKAASRGIAQLKDGVGRVVRMQNVGDTLRQRQAGRRLGGLCGAARGFMANGRAQMLPSAYDPPTRTLARQLALQIDSLITYAPTCERTATRTPGPVAARVGDLLHKYEAAVLAWRTAVGLPNK